MAFHLFMSNSLEKLAALFQENLPPPENDVFTPVCAVVPNSGMAFFLERTLARKDHLGISANIECSFLQKFISEQIGNSLPPEEAKEYAASSVAWSPAVLSWRIDALFAREPERFPYWRSYWQHDGKDDAELRHLLSCELARTLDRYQLHRGKELAEWREGREPDSPQAKLFRALCEEVPAPEKFHAGFLHSKCAHPEKLPAKIGVFGVGSMPEFYLQCLKKLSEVSEVFLFSPSPCRIYWGDFRSSRELAKEPDALEIFEERARNNIVLSDLGSSGRKFLDLLLKNEFFTDDPDEYVEPGNDTVLHLFQTDILDGVARHRKKDDPPVDRNDRSVRVCSAPTARRELEALHDHLAELFYASEDGGKKLRPEDVIVMFPDINKAAPMIESVFANGPFDGKFAICDRSTAGQSPLIECFGKLLALPRSRCTSQEVLAFLDFPCIHRKLGLDSETLPALTRLAVRARICWGLSGAERLKFRGNGYEEFSWQDGIDRLLTEFARGEIMDDLFSGKETEGVDGDCAEDFGKLAEFVQDLRKWKRELPKPRTAGEWQEFLCAWADIFFDASDPEVLPELRALREAVEAVAGSAEKAGFTGEIAPEVFLSRFNAEVSAPGGRQYFLRDKITFCSLVPLRAIPARIIAVLSLNEQDFPPSDRHQDFDLLSTPLRGDPNRAEESKYLLLEALMAAKEHLILSYVGKDDSRDPEPSVPLAVCIKALKEGFGFAPDEMPEKIRLPSVESDELRKFRKQEKKDSGQAEEISGEPKELPHSMDLAEFCSHLADSCGAFFEFHRGFPFAPWQDKTPKVDDPPAPDALDKSLIGKALWKMYLGGGLPEDWRRRFGNTRLLPVCRGGEALDELKRKIDRIGEDELGDAGNSEVKPFSYPLAEGFELCGRIGVCEKEDKIRHLEFLFSGAKEEKKLRFYVERLLIAAARPEKEVSGKQHFVFDEKKPFFDPVTPAPADAGAALRALGEIVIANCKNTTRPVPLFLNASLAAAKGKSDFDVRQAFREDCASRGGAPSAVSFFYPTEEILDGAEFKELAARVFGKLIVLENRKS
ncbi:MAG: exodeoxyribonuclease V subunit gamma [Lentisphaeria bacterium]|nr:exodeoxyribonuclease V subunit gamma [Lentisphaeria bacterium]